MARATVTPGHPMASRRSLSEAGPGSGYQTTPGILIGLLVGLLLLLIFIPGFCCIFQVCIPPPLPRAPASPAAHTAPRILAVVSHPSLSPPPQLTTPKYFPDPNAPEKGKDPYALAEGNNPPFKRGAF